MRTEKGYKAEIFWESNFEAARFRRMLEHSKEMYGVLIVKGGLYYYKNILCIFKSAKIKDEIIVQDLPALRTLTFPMKKVLGFALLEQYEIRVVKQGKS